MRICFIAPSGYGKTTAVNYLEKNYNAKNIKIADFLYEIQNYIYKRMDIDIKGKQDGELLQFLGSKIRSIDDTFLLRDFSEKVFNLDNEIVLNDDCRPLDYEWLRALGFKFVKINGFSRDREDITRVDKKNSLEWQNLPICDYEINNFNSLENYYNELDNLVRMIKNDRQVLHYTNTKNM